MDILFVVISIFVWSYYLTTKNERYTDKEVDRVRDFIRDTNEIMHRIRKRQEDFEEEIYKKIRNIQAEIRFKKPIPEPEEIDKELLKGE